MPFVDQMPTPLDVAIAMLLEQVKGQPPTVENDESWLTYFLNKDRLVAQSVRSLVPVILKAQAAAIPTSPIGAGILPTGPYLLAYYLRITQAASVSSSVQPTFNWTDGAQACSRTGAAVTGNTTNTTDSGIVLVQADAPGTLTYTTTYASVGGVPMQYNLEIAIFKVPNAA